MPYRIIRKSEQITTQWSGGTTTQLMIYPLGADYANRDFLFRISTAKVEAEESTFTQLPGIERKMMILEGKLEISHQNHHHKKLGKFDVDQFSGDWLTKGKGRVTDFNLMTRPNIQGDMKAKVLNPDEVCEIDLKKSTAFGLYIYSGSVTFQVHQNHNTLSQNDFLFLENEEGEIMISAVQKTEIVLVQVQY